MNFMLINVLQASKLNNLQINHIINSTKFETGLNVIFEVYLSFLALSFNSKYYIISISTSLNMKQNALSNNVLYLIGRSFAILYY